MKVKNFHGSWSSEALAWGYQRSYEGKYCAMKGAASDKMKWSRLQTAFIVGWRVSRLKEVVISINSYLTILISFAWHSWNLSTTWLICWTSESVREEKSRGIASPAMSMADMSRRHPAAPSRLTHSVLPSDVTWRILIRGRLVLRPPLGTRCGEPFLTRPSHPATSYIGHITRDGTCNKDLTLQLWHLTSRLCPPSPRRRTASPLHYR